ncbi:MAG TPA: metallophosphoesterase [Candidatus Limivivens merdigallinarum]|uniref:Phosphoesterase n=1 Tax=Candidatus Limivivens merdigallinarum TaxID=2840859 RepID=A0A9D0ZTB5_9FIRM|nr:metallophosphoesterase [Candidatus Limivivens merdigallinarum]
MKILIVSDTHRQVANLQKVLKKISPIDCLIHLGDVEGSEDYIREIADCPCHFVSGNNDFFCDLPREKEITLGKYKVLLTHGHYYYVSLDTRELRRQAVSRGFDIVMFGHTHRPYLAIEEQYTILNPGSISYPRQEGRKPSYIIMEIDKNGDAHYAIHYL